MDKKTMLMLAASGLLIILLSAAAFYKTQLSRQENILARAEPDQSCDLQKSGCKIDLGEGASISLEIAPKPIPLVTKFDIQVALDSVEAESVWVDFKGTSMNMGPNTVKLNKVSQGQYKGNGMLPVCVRNSMEWQAEVIVRTKAGSLIAPFIFVTHK